MTKEIREFIKNNAKLIEDEQELAHSQWQMLRSVTGNSRNIGQVVDFLVHKAETVGGNNLWKKVADPSPWFDCSGKKELWKIIALKLMDMARNQKEMKEMCDWVYCLIDQVRHAQKLYILRQNVKTSGGK